MTRHLRRWLLLLASTGLLLTAWVAFDLTAPATHELTDFDGSQVGRIETAMWRSYYEQRPLRLFGQLTGLLRTQYHAPFWRATVGAAYAARAAVIFQRGHERSEYLLALPTLESFYKVLRRGSRTPFDVRKAAATELEWWIVHRERAQSAPGDLERWLAELQEVVYQQPAWRFREHAKLRAEAMVLRDASAATGGVSEKDWLAIGEMLERSWTSLHTAVTTAQ